MILNSATGFSKKTCVNSADLAASAARASAKSAARAEAAAKEAEKLAATMTPYIGANGNWWQGDKDSGISARGTAGPPGAAGEPGPQGAPGEPGPAGLTPYIGANGHWWTGDEDSGVSASGDGISRTEFETGLSSKISATAVTQPEYDKLTISSNDIYIIQP